MNITQEKIRKNASIKAANGRFDKFIQNGMFARNLRFYLSTYAEQSNLQDFIQGKYDDKFLGEKRTL